MWLLRSWFAPLAYALGTAACAAPSAAPDPRAPTASPPPPVPANVVKSTYTCATDSDCVIGTPGNCCVQYCADERVPWSKSAWAAREAHCAVVDCDVVERNACPPRDTPGPAPDAACVEGVCSLVYR